MRAWYKIRFLSVFVLSCKNESNLVKGAKETKTDTFTELNRPQYQFIPTKDWMNDPNGLGTLVIKI